MIGDQVVAITEEWLETPYKHQHSVKGAGCDCLGLIRGVWRDVVGDEPEKAPPYSPSWGEGDDQEMLLSMAHKYMSEVVLADMQAGDVIIFRMVESAPAKHCAIYAGQNHMIHAYQNAGKVARHHMGSYWRRRIVGVFRIQGVA